jgi:polar amino acid transport system substrate-binding protein
MTSAGIDPHTFRENRMKSILIAAAALALSAGLASAQTIRLGTEGAYPPYNFINDAGEVDGFERELGDKLCEMEGLTCEWVKNDWDSIIPNLVSGNYDAIIAGMSINDERDKVIDFSDPYLPPAPSAYIALSPDANIATGNIAAQTGTVQADYIASSGAKLMEFASPEETVAAVRNGEADAAFADRDFLNAFVEESGGELVFLGDIVKLDKGIGMGFRESDADLRAKFNDGIGKLKADGSMNAMITKWFGDQALTW